MCSSPKGSTTRRRHSKKSELSHSEYEEYARMMRRASAVYDRIEQEKAERRQSIASQKDELTDSQKDVSKPEDKSQSNVFSAIKTFLLKSVFSD